MYVIATAGHVDHGKSTLVRALTGMEPDRWAEERRRGMTIDLGYAWMTLNNVARAAEARGPGGEQLAFVDVPGHERFVPNMLAGLGPVPAVMFVVAADGGWMPQSAEHLAAVNALGVRHGLLVITRSDLADPEPATRQARAEIARTSLGGVEAVQVSAVTGQGMNALRAALARLAGSLSGDPGLGGPQSSGRSEPGGRSEMSGAGAPDISDISTSGGDAPVRLWIDRSFTIRGAGTVVTGTLPAGTVRNDQELVLTPSGRTVRVRGLEALGEPADEVSGVARVALNLRGVPADLTARGMALIQPGRWALTSEVDVRVTPSAADPHPKFPPDLLMHVGSARTPARVRLLGVDSVYARLRLKEPLPLHVGDRVILRDPGAAGLAVYGATVLDPFPPPLARRGAGAAAARELAAWPDVPAAADLLRRHKLLRVPQLAAAGVTGRPEPVAGDWLADPEHWAWLRAELPRVVAAFCAKDPLAPGMPAEAARSALALPSRDLVAALTAGEVVLDGAYLRIFTRQAGGEAGAAPGPARTAGQLPQKIADAVLAVLDDLADDPFAAPDTERLRALGLDARALAAAARVGLLLRVADLVVLAPGADKAAAGVLAGLEQPFTTSQARQALRTSRRVVIPLLEYLDRARVTERLPGDLRRVRALPAGRSAADGGHRAVGVKEGRVVDPVSRQLGRDRRPPPRGDLVVRGSGSQQGAQVAFRPGEQAVADLAVGREPHPVARAAERAGDGRDHPDPGRAAIHQERLGGGSATHPFGILGKRERAGQRVEDLVRGDHLRALPPVLRVERHLLDEPKLVAALQAVAQQVGRLILVQVAHQHRVDLDGRQARGRRGRQAGQHVGEPVAVGQLPEDLGAQGVE